MLPSQPRFEVCLNRGAVVAYFFPGGANAFPSYRKSPTDPAGALFGNVTKQKGFESTHVGVHASVEKDGVKAQKLSLLLLLM